MARDTSKIFSGKTLCTCCGELKDNLKFAWYKTRFYNKGPMTGYRERIHSQCSDCMKSYNKEVKGIKTKYPNLQKPSFGEPCELCAQPVEKSWQLDHCHETGEFRGWLCKRCNTGLGNLGDNKTSLLKALSYLERAENGLNESQKKLNIEK